MLDLKYIVYMDMYVIYAATTKKTQPLPQKNTHTKLINTFK